MIDVNIIVIFAGMITPVYIALFTIYRKLGYLEGCIGCQ